MTASTIPSAKTSSKTSCGTQIETLEGRQLMSITPIHSAILVMPLPKPEPLPAIVKHSVNIHQTEIKLIKNVNVVKSAVSIVNLPIHLPETFVEPKVNSSVTGWENFSKEPLFAAGGPSANDIIQGQVGDCWFLSSLAEVAMHDPTDIKNMVTQRADGTYDVRFHTSATTTVDEHVDGLLPINAYGGLEYAQLGTSNCDWVPIVEKAFTYFRNRNIAAAYSTISGGWGSEAFTDFGATPTEVLSGVTNATTLFNDVVWSMIFNCDTDFGIGGTAGPLVNSHEYSVVSARVQGGVDQIEVRNPWGYNPNFVANTNGYGSTNNGYMWVNASSVLPQLNEFVNANV